MEPFELKLKNALTRTEPIPAAELTALKDQIVRTFARKQKSFFCLMATYLAVMTILIVALLALFICTTDLKQCLLYGLIILVLFEGTVLMKLWYWGMHGKIATIREIKLLQLAVAELKARPSSESHGAASAVPDEGGPAPVPTPTAPSSRKLWRAILVPLWLLAIANLVYWGWLQNPYEPRDVTTYFEKSGSAADGAAKTQWQQSFEVTQARQRFFPQVVTRGQIARVWISVGAENHEPVFTGPVETGSMIGFGQAVPGRYVVRGRTEAADGDFTLRISGVDEVPGVPLPDRLFVRLFLLMLSAAMIIAIPLVWLQGRWLRRIDPELERW